MLRKKLEGQEESQMWRRGSCILIQTITCEADSWHIHGRLDYSEMKGTFTPLLYMLFQTREGGIKACTSDVCWHKKFMIRSGLDFGQNILWYTSINGRKTQHLDDLHNLFLKVKIKNILAFLLSTLNKTTFLRKFLQNMKGYCAFWREVSHEGFYLML